MSKLLHRQTIESRLQQLNPEFQGIARNLAKKHSVKKQAEQEKRIASNRLHYLQKEEDMTEKKVLKKQRELQTLMNVIARKQYDQEKKESLRQAREEAQAQQRQLNMKRRSIHQERVRNAFLSLYDQRHDDVSLMRNTFKKNEQMKKSFQKDLESQNQERVLKKSQEREEGKHKISNFHKERIDLYTSRYKQKIKLEEEEAQKLSQQAHLYSNQEKMLKSKIQNSSSRIEALESEIEKIASEYKSLSVNRSLNWSSFSNHYQKTQTKEQNTKDPQTDYNFEKQLQGQLNIN